MRTFVYFDERRSTSWISRGEARALASLLSELGAEVVDARGLAEVLSSPPSVVVFAQDVAPEEALGGIRGFLEGGGVAVWLGDIPFFYVDRSGVRETLGVEGGIRVLGFNPAGAPWDQGLAEPTGEGRAYGLAVPHPSFRPTRASYVDVVLTATRAGDAASWVKRYGRGFFVRLLDYHPITGASGLLNLAGFLARGAVKLGAELRLPPQLSSAAEALAQAPPSPEDIRAVDALSAVLEPSARLLGELADALLKGFGHLIERLRAAAARELGATRIYWLAQSHIDWAWLWTWEETVEKCRRTFARNLGHMRARPGYVYHQSSAAFYKWMEERYPELFEEIRRRVAEGRWVIVGASWVEHDCNLPSGEAMVRQRLYAQRYFLSRFGRLSEVEWMPDTFGFTWTLPQILAKSGVKYFLTTKLEWNRYNPFPLRAFRWRSPDGSEVIAYAGVAMAKPTLSRALLNRLGSTGLLAKGVYSYANPPSGGGRLDAYAVLYGRGDGGEGPTEEEVDAAYELARLLPGSCKPSSALEFFRELEGIREELPVWCDELYLEEHTGTYTAQQRMKYLNRRGECLLVAAEKLASLAYLRGAAYPEAQLREAWEWLLSYQHHDPLPGSAIRAVYEEAERDFREHVFQRAGEAVERARSALAPPGDALVVFNPLSWERVDAVELPEEGVPLDGAAEAPVQRTADGRLVALLRAPPVGVRAYAFKRARVPEPHLSDAEPPVVLESEHYRLVVGREGVEELYDKDIGLSLLKAPVRIVSYYCKPSQWDNWNIMERYWEHERGRFAAKRVRVADGPVFASAILEGELEGCPATWEVRLYKGLKRVDFVITVDWRVSHRIVKLYFPFALEAEYAYASIPFGVYPRPFKPRNSYEEARWEFPHGKWVCVSDGRVSVVVANWTNHGSSLIGGVYGLTLIKNGKEPDPECDLRRHELRVSLTSYAGDWRAGAPWRLGDELNYPMIAWLGSWEGGELSLVRVEPAHAVVEAVKKWEDGDALVVRVYDAAGLGGRCRLEFPVEVEGAEEVDMLELNRIGEVSRSGRFVEFELRPWEVKTVKVKLARARPR